MIATTTKNPSVSKPPDPWVLDRMARAALLIAGGKTEAEARRALRLAPNAFHYFRHTWPEHWQQACDRAGAASGLGPMPNPAPGPKGPSAVNADRMTRAALLVARGLTKHAAARQLGLPVYTIQALAERHPDRWRSELEKAREQMVREALPSLKRAKVKTSDQPTPEVLDRIRKATALRAAGLGILAISVELGIQVATVCHYERWYPKVWQQELDRAMQAALIVVRRQAGSEEMLADPETHIRRALAVKRWANACGQAMFESNGEPTLSSFFAEFYRPTRLDRASPKTIEGYLDVLRRWKFITGDSPLKEISVLTLTRFRDALRKLRGKQAPWKYSEWSVVKAMTHVQAILDAAGPPDRRMRDAAGILEKVPYLRKPRLDPPEPKIPRQEWIDAMYTAAIAADRPRLPGVSRPAQWWRSLIAVCYNTGLRKGSLMGLRFAEVDWEHHCLILPPGRMKTRRRQVIHLNETAYRHLLLIRGPRDLVFEYPHGSATFHKDWRKLQAAAGVPLSERFGLHGLRKFLATTLFATEPAAAQLALGHTTPRVTVAHYVSGGPIVAAALDRLQQPAAFGGAAATIEEEDTEEPAGVALAAR